MYYLVKGELEEFMIKNEIQIIKELCEKLKEEYRSEFFTPAKEVKIQNWEREYNITLPELYKEWLRFSDGAVIRGNLAYFYGIEGIEVNNPQYPEDFIIIGDLIGDGERLAFSKATGKILRINHGQVREYEDFGTFLNKMVIRMLRA